MAIRVYEQLAAQAKALAARLREVKPTATELNGSYFTSVGFERLDSDLNYIVQQRETVKTCKHERVNERRRRIGYGRNQTVQITRRCRTCEVE